VPGDTEVRDYTITRALRHKTSEQMQTRDWCFTINNPEGPDIEATYGLWENELCTYIVYQYERGEEGTLHMQGFRANESKDKNAQNE